MNTRKYKIAPLVTTAIAVVTRGGNPEYTRRVAQHRTLRCHYGRYKSAKRRMKTRMQELPLDGR